VSAVDYSFYCSYKFDDEVINYDLLACACRYDPVQNKRSHSVKATTIRKEKLKTLNWAMCMFCVFMRQCFH